MVVKTDIVVSLLFLLYMCYQVVTNTCGTGTTTATVLTRAIFTEGCKSVAAGMNPMDLRRGITQAVDAVVTHLKSRAKAISTTEEIAQVRVAMHYEMYCVRLLEA